jgi:hypothetical protein
MYPRYVDFWTLPRDRSRAHVSRFDSDVGKGVTIRLGYSLAIVWDDGFARIRLGDGPGPDLWMASQGAI